VGEDVVRPTGVRRIPKGLSKVFMRRITIAWGDYLVVVKCIKLLIDGISFEHLGYHPWRP
jgi:hypothetical protein